MGLKENVDRKVLSLSFHYRIDLPFFGVTFCEQSKQVAHRAHEGRSVHEKGLFRGREGRNEI